MSNQYSVSLKELAEEFQLDSCFQSSDFDRVRVMVDDISRPGLPLAGFFDHFEPMRLYVIGAVEHTYLEKLSAEERTIIADHFFSYRMPGLIIARGMEPQPECVAMAEKHNLSILRSHDTTSHLISSLISFLNGALAPRTTQHGVLVEVYGEGILLVGDSGIGKSEAAVELVKRGHRLIADDAVEIKRISPQVLVGSAPEVLRHYIELRGAGVVDVARLFGMGAVKDSANIDLVVNIVHWQDNVMYDRLGLDEQYTEILDVKIPSITVPVTPGRNLAVIFEVAAMNNRQKRQGYNAAEIFTLALKKQFEGKNDTL